MSMQTADVTRRPTVDQVFGDNKAPMADVLNSDFEDLSARVSAMAMLLKGSNKKITNDDGNAAVGKLVIDARNLVKEVEGTRTAEGKPLLEATRELNGFFNQLKAIVEDDLTPLKKRANDYAAEKAAAARAKALREAEAARKKAEAARRKAEEAKTAQGAGAAEGRAEAQENLAATLEDKAQANAADLTRSRAGGVTSSTRTSWEFIIEDRPALIASLGPLGHFIDQAAIEKAIRSVVRIQKDQATIPGVRVYEDHKASFR